MEKLIQEMAKDICQSYTHSLSCYQIELQKLRELHLK